MLSILNQYLAESRCLAPDQIAAAIQELVDETVPAADKAEFLTCLARKGETPEEIACFARELRARSVPSPVRGELRGRPLLDVVGTGGDRLSTFNISTTVALLAASAGVPVAKHGNRASTSPIGSADVMEALELAFDLGPSEAAQALELCGFAYFFAPRYHPAFKHIIPARKLCGQQGQATIFNILGPMLNPAQPSAALIGVPRPEMCRPMAEVLQSLGVRRAMVVSGAVEDEHGVVRYLDELSPLGPTTIAEFYQPNGIISSELSPHLFPMQTATLADLRGGDRQVNAAIVRSILEGRERGPKRDAVLLNASAALFVADRVKTLQEGWQLASELIDTGVAWRKFQDLRQFAAKK